MVGQFLGMMMLKLGPIRMRKAGWDQRCVWSARPLASQRPKDANMPWRSCFGAACGASAVMVWVLFILNSGVGCPCAHVLANMLSQMDRWTKKGNACFMCGWFLGSYDLFGAQKSMDLLQWVLHSSGKGLHRHRALDPVCSGVPWRVFVAAKNPRAHAIFH